MGKIISFYLKRMLANSQHQEQSLEVNADLIDNVNEKMEKATGAFRHSKSSNKNALNHKYKFLKIISVSRTRKLMK